VFEWSDMSTRVL